MIGIRITRQFVDDVVNHLSKVQLAKKDWVTTNNLIVAINNGYNIPKRFKKIIVSEDSGKVVRGIYIILAMHECKKYDIDCDLSFK